MISTHSLVRTHNSAYYDEYTGQYALIFHTRFPAEGERHEVRVHSFTFNAAGWPVVAPLRYAGEPDVTVKPMDARQVTGGMVWGARR